MSRSVARRAAQATALALAVVLFPGCDSDSGGDNGGSNQPAGTFSIEIEGESGGTFAGNASFGAAADASGSYFALILTATATGGSSQITYIASRGGRPATGNYSFGDANQDLEDLPAGTFIALIIDGGVPNWSKSGTLRITSSSTSNVAGSFEFEVESVEVNSDGSAGELTRTVSGSFNATSAPVVIPF